MVGVLTSLAFHGQQSDSLNQTLRPFENPRRSGHPEVLTLVKGCATRPSYEVYSPGGSRQRHLIGPKNPSMKKPTSVRIVLHHNPTALSGTESDRILSPKIYEFAFLWRRILWEGSPATNLILL